MGDGARKAFVQNAGATLQLDGHLGWPKLNLVQVPVSEVPEPVVSFFNHDGSMTAHLESVAGCPIALDVLGAVHTEGCYRRLVILRRSDDRTPLLLAGIEVVLDQFASGVRQEIERAALPFGRVLGEAEVSCEYVPVSYFVFRPSAQIRTAMNVAKDQPLYGRTKVVQGEDGRLLAIVVEIPAGQLGVSSK